MSDFSLEVHLVLLCYNFNISSQPYCSALQRKTAPEGNEQQLAVQLSRNHVISRLLIF